MARTLHDFILADPHSFLPLSPPSRSHRHRSSSPDSSCILRKIRVHVSYTRLHELVSFVECNWNPEKTIDGDRKSTRLNSSHTVISYAVFCLKKKKFFILGDLVDFIRMSKRMRISFECVRAPR